MRAHGPPTRPTSSGSATGAGRAGWACTSKPPSRAALPGGCDQYVHGPGSKARPKSIPLMNLQAWLTLGVAVLALAALARDLAPDAVFLGASVFLVLLGFVKPAEAFGGFCSPGVLT